MIIIDMYVCLYVYLTTHSDIPLRRRGKHIVSFCLWPILQDTGAPTTHNKPGFLMCRVCSTDKRDHCSWEEPVHIFY